MKHRLYLLSIFFLSSCSNLGYENEDERFFNASETLYYHGDTFTSIQNNYDESEWSATKKSTKGDEVFWSRKTIEIIKPRKKFQLIGLMIQAFGAYEVYWNGVLIGTNGKPGLESKTEKEGTQFAYFVIPNDLFSIGKHSLALKISRFYDSEDRNDFYPYIEDYHRLVKEPLITTLFINILAGAFLVASIYYFILYINDRKKQELLLFSLASLLFFLLVIMEYLKFYIPIHYSFFYLRLEIIGVLILLVSFLVPYYFTVQFPFKQRKLFIVIYGILLFAIFVYFRGHYDYTAILLGQLIWGASTLIIINAIFKKQKTAIVVLIGLILSFIVYKSAIYDVSLFVSFGILSLCMFYVLSIKLKEQRLAFEHSIAQSTRLKYELLKKKIQPHFLMNTLTSLIDWVEEAPEKGVKFIEALAEEFDLLNQIENKTLIPVFQEIKLCKSYLNIMKYRKEITYNWEDDVNSKDETLTIPPAVLHTLLENGITHCLPDKNNEINFKLSIDKTIEKQKITFLTLAKVRAPKTIIEDGTGFKYVKARLTESYGNNWILTSQAVENGWKNEIIITV